MDLPRKCLSLEKTLTPLIFMAMSEQGSKGKIGTFIFLQELTRFWGAWEVFAWTSAVRGR